jgi:hypothetical protein
MSEWQAGLELDKWIALWVFDLEAEIVGERAYIRGPSGHPQPQGLPLDDRVLPRYSSDLLAAWEVFERFGLEWYIKRDLVRSGADEQQWTVYREDSPPSGGRLIVVATAATFPLAIGRAVMEEVGLASPPDEGPIPPGG